MSASESAMYLARLGYRVTTRSLGTSEASISLSTA
jgi:hypothetical protein